MIHDNAVVTTVYVVRLLCFPVVIADCRVVRVTSFSEVAAICFPDPVVFSCDIVGSYPGPPRVTFHHCCNNVSVFLTLDLGDTHTIFQTNLYCGWIVHCLPKADKGFGDSQSFSFFD